MRRDHVRGRAGRRAVDRQRLISGVDHIPRIILRAGHVLGAQASTATAT
jgi:hypothetical protein